MKKDSGILNLLTIVLVFVGINFYRDYKDSVIAEKRMKIDSVTIGLCDAKARSGFGSYDTGNDICVCYMFNDKFFRVTPYTYRFKEIDYGFFLKVLVDPDDASDCYFPESFISYNEKKNKEQFKELFKQRTKKVTEYPKFNKRVKRKVFSALEESDEVLLSKIVVRSGFFNYFVTIYYFQEDWDLKLEQVWTDHSVDLKITKL